jgi:hypothetical protein
MMYKDKLHWLVSLPVRGNNYGGNRKWLRSLGEILKEKKKVE